MFDIENYSKQLRSANLGKDGGSLTSRFMINKSRTFRTNSAQSLMSARSAKSAWTVRRSDSLNYESEHGEMLTRYLNKKENRKLIPYYEDILTTEGQ